MKFLLQLSTTIATLDFDEKTKYPENKQELFGEWVDLEHLDQMDEAQKARHDELNNLSFPVSYHFQRVILMKPDPVNLLAVNPCTSLPAYDLKLLNETIAIKEKETGSESGKSAFESLADY